MPRKKKTPTQNVEEPVDYGFTPISIGQGDVQMLAVDDIEMDGQFRFRMKVLTGALEKSIAENGLQVPIIVRPLHDGDRPYQLISGYRRLTAIKGLKQKKVAAIVRSDLVDDDDAFRASVLENVQRKTYSNLDLGYLVLEWKKREDYSLDKAAHVLGVSKRQVQNLAKLTKLPKRLQEEIQAESNFTSTHALVLHQAVDNQRADGYDEWIERVNGDEQLSVGRLQRAINAAHKAKSKAGEAPVVRSLFRDDSAKAGEFWLQPVKLTPSEMSEEEKASYREELQKLLKALS